MSLRSRNRSQWFQYRILDCGDQRGRAAGRCRTPRVGGRSSGQLTLASGPPRALPVRPGIDSILYVKSCCLAAPPPEAGRSVRHGSQLAASAVLRARWIPSPWDRGSAAAHASTSRSDHRTAAGWRPARSRQSFDEAGRTQLPVRTWTDPSSLRGVPVGKRFGRIEALRVAQLDRCYAHAERAVVTSPTSATRRGFRRKSRILAPRPTRCASETGGFRVRGLPEPRVVPTYPLD